MVQSTFSLYLNCRLITLLQLGFFQFSIFCYNIGRVTHPHCHENVHSSGIRPKLLQDLSLRPSSMWALPPISWKPGNCFASPFQMVLFFSQFPISFFSNVCESVLFQTVRKDLTVDIWSSVCGQHLPFQFSALHSNGVFVFSRQQYFLSFWGLGTMEIRTRHYVWAIVWFSLFVFLTLHITALHCLLFNVWISVYKLSHLFCQFLHLYKRE